MSKSRSPRQYLGVRAILPPDLQLATRNPTDSDTVYVRGTLWLNYVSGTAWQWPGSGSWIALGSGASGGVVTINSLSPVGGNIIIAGTANQISISNAGHTVTLSLPAAITAPGSLTTTTTLTAGTNFSAIGGTSTFVGTFHANVTGAATSVIGTGGTGAVQIGNATGNTAVTGSLTASTTLTATLGAITATNGNLVLGTAGNKILSTSVATTTTAGDNSFGSVTLVGGTATVATSAVTTNSLIVIWRQTVGATGAAALGHLCHSTITNGVSFIINSNLTADATSLATTDVSSVGWMIIN